uniref:ubiquinone biosynthesis protein COQ9-B, mitochondrial n=1 Tax=Erigeron canadensis TaxID=72917 RepID=UPI001CB89AAE|nr:ubiquinone biosynthesis protein COQ9-B, mitochondrial [Erigeron canadensis]
MYRRAVAKGLRAIISGNKQTITTSRCCSSQIIRNPNHQITSRHQIGSFGGGGIRFISSEAPPPPPPIKREPEIPPIISSGNGLEFQNINNNNSFNDSTTSKGDRRRKRNVSTGSYEDEQSRVLAASLLHVMKLGWSEAALIAGARDVGVSPSIVGSIPRKQAVLVEYFMDQCLQHLIDVIDSGDLNLQDLVPSERIAKLVKFRLQMQAPYISKWPQALSIQAQPSNFPTSFKQRAMLVDEFWHASNDEDTGVDWYLKRTVLGGIYSTTEVYMLTDNSTDFHDTWLFLNDRVRDAFDLKKTFQEVKYFAEAVGAGVGGSFQGFMKKSG